MSTDAIPIPSSSLAATSCHLPHPSQKGSGSRSEGLPTLKADVSCSSDPPPDGSIFKCIEDHYPIPWRRANRLWI